MYDRLQAANREGGSPEVLMSRLVQTHVASHATMRAPLYLIQHEFSALTAVQRKVILKRRDALERFFKDCLMAGSEKGVFNVSNPALTNIAILSLCISVLNWFVPEGELTPDEVGALYAELVLRMISSSGAPLRGAGASSKRAV
jgi:hypothetical protein